MWSWGEGGHGSCNLVDRWSLVGEFFAGSVTSKRERVYPGQMVCLRADVSVDPKKWIPGSDPKDLDP